jgi:hypothetical protein
VDLTSQYTHSANQHQAAAARAQQQFRLVGNLRLLTGIAALILAFFVFGNNSVSPWWFCLPLVVFTALAVRHANIEQKLNVANRSARFYQQGLARITNRWMGTGEQGNRFRDPNHVYAEDLDLFGKGSLYELLCTVRTRAGEDALAGWLLKPSPMSLVLARQAAVDELAPRLQLREQLALIGEDVRTGLHTELVAAWGSKPAVPFPPGLHIIAACLSAGTLASLIGYLTDFWGRLPLLVFVLLQLGLSFFLRPRVREVVEAVELPSHDLDHLAGLLRRIEREPCNSALLCELKDRLKTAGLTASEQIARLEVLANRLEWTHNEFFKPIAAVLMWSTHLAVAIERWRTHSGASIERWIATAGDFEALCALAVYRFEHPEDPFPDLRETGPVFDGTELGHPLIISVRNDIRVGKDRPVIVVSGSNMSGKSTLLRTVGLNTALAWAGAPVRAARLSVSPLQVAASMRLQDSLQDGKSRFYAEITRLRQILELTSGPLPVLFLLDELLSGTNSHDRQIGAAAIVASLVERGAVGMLTTHDLALADIAEGFNVHFTDMIEDGKLHFDYRLRPGIVEHSNAIELMRSVGLPV